MDLVVDQYFEVLDKIETQIQDLESDISDNENHQFKHHWHLMRGRYTIDEKSYTPLRLQTDSKNLKIHMRQINTISISRICMITF
ncbi:MAG: hypothetical protein IPI60_17450 [Saprospiraceae bacterium]|nr:hypothetical protein [Saprospiraceae bacterium]